MRITWVLQKCHTKNLRVTYTTLRWLHMCHKPTRQKFTKTMYHISSPYCVTYVVNMYYTRLCVWCPQIVYTKQPIHNIKYDMTQNTNHMYIIYFYLYVLCYVLCYVMLCVMSCIMPHLMWSYQPWHRNYEFYKKLPVA